MVSDGLLLSLAGVGGELTYDLTALLSRDGRAGGAFALVFPQQTAYFPAQWSICAAPRFRKCLYLNADQYAGSKQAPIA